MKIREVEANQGKIEVIARVVEKQDVRTFNKFGKEGRVCTAKLQDDSGEILLTLWNDDIEKVGQGDTIKVVNGWCAEFRGERQLSAGKFGSIELVEKAKGDTTKQEGVNLPPPPQKRVITAKEAKEEHERFSNEEMVE
jgi:replication factor A1